MGATGENFEHICEIEKSARSARVLSVMEAQHSHIFSYIFLISGNWSSATLAGKIKNSCLGMSCPSKPPTFPLG